MNEQQWLTSIDHQAMVAFIVANEQEREWLDRKLRLYNEGQAVLLRCLFGNPWRPATLCGRTWISPEDMARHEDCQACAAILAWNDGAVRKIARTIYDDPNGSVLADALEEAGCDSREVLRHLREPLHVRSCWVIDMILGER